MWSLGMMNSAVSSTYICSSFGDGRMCKSMPSPWQPQRQMRMTTSHISMRYFQGQCFAASYSRVSNTTFKWKHANHCLVMEPHGYVSCIAKAWRTENLPFQKQEGQIWQVQMIQTSSCLLLPVLEIWNSITQPSLYLACAHPSLPKQATSRIVLHILQHISQELSECTM